MLRYKRIVEAKFRLTTRKRKLPAKMKWEHRFGASVGGTLTEWIVKPLLSGNENPWVCLTANGDTITLCGHEFGSGGSAGTFLSAAVGWFAFAGIAAAGEAMHPKDIWRWF